MSSAGRAQTGHMNRLIDLMTPCGPLADAKAAGRLQALVEDRLAEAWPLLAPVFSASAYLAGLARRNPDRLVDLLTTDPDLRLEDLLARTRSVARAPLAGAKAGLRLLKQEAHLLTALADLGGVWTLDQVTGALARFADVALQAALTLAAREEVEAGRLTLLGLGADGPVPGYFCIAMGKHGAFELNYSSDIDFSVFYEPDLLPLAEGVESQGFAVRLTQRVADLMQDRTAEGYVFRVDLRLRPDPSSTPPAVPVPAALEYYETVGQNWERAAFIKARACAGDIPRGQAFLAELLPFIWRKNLDFAAIADIHSIKRQIHVHKVDDRLTAKGMDLKLGRGGIREIEFYVQTQQLILGGRHPELRSCRTLEALEALRLAGHVTDAAARDMTEAYGILRAAEHRIQMLADEQTHRLPESDTERKRVAALMGYGNLRSFDAFIERTLKSVNRRYGELFPDEEPLSSRFGSLIFTGVEDDPETLKTLGRMGFSSPPRIAQTIRAWHHGHISATRTERGRELFTRLAPRLLDAAQATGAPDAAFTRFEDFFSRIGSGVQLQSLFLAQPRLFELVVQVMAFAPKLARTLARRPAALDAMLDPGFFESLSDGEDARAMAEAMRGVTEFEPAMDVVRRVHREQSFRVGVQVMSGSATAEAAGRAFASLADVCIGTLAPVALAEVERLAGTLEGEVAVVALGKCGSREMNAGSDLDLMTLYRSDSVSSLKSLSPDVFYGRFTQRLIAALSIPTGEGELYEVDMKLRPSGSKGPVAVSFQAFETYHGGEAETWEHMALTRARVVWASSASFGTAVGDVLEGVLRRPRVAAQILQDVLEMRDLMARERPPRGDWDLKLSPGGFVDIEFAAQYLQLIHGADGGPLAPNTAEVLAALSGGGLAPADAVKDLLAAWTLQQNLTQLLKVALPDGADPEDEPKAFRTLLARAGQARDVRGLKTRLATARKRARRAYDIILPS